MKKESIVIFVIIIILVVGLFVIFYPKEKLGVYESPCESIELKEALNKSDVSLCELVPQSTEMVNGVGYPYYDNVCREGCIRQIAYNEGDAQLCELINSFKNIPHVEGWVDPRETGSKRDFCYIELAQKLGNVSLCNNVETDWAKTHCSSLYDSHIDWVKNNCSPSNKSNNCSFLYENLVKVGAITESN